MQTTPSGQPALACLRQQPHTENEVAVFAASHIEPSATVVSDGLWCFGPTTIVGAEHERDVSGGGMTSVKLPQFKAINPLLGNLKTAAPRGAGAERQGRREVRKVHCSQLN